MSFHFRCSIGTAIAESEDNGGVVCSFCFVAAGLPDYQSFSRRSLTYLFILLMITIKDWDPSFVMESTLISVPYRHKWFVIWTSNIGPIFCVSSNPSSQSVFSSFRRDGYYRRHSAFPNPIKFMSWIIMKYGPREIFVIKEVYAQGSTHTYVSLKFSSRSLCQLNISLSTGILMEQRIRKKIDTTLGFETPIHHSSPQKVLHVLVHEWSEICWPNSSHHRYCPLALTCWTEMIMRNNHSGVVESPL